MPKKKSGNELLGFLLFFVLPGLGIPSAVTWALSGSMNAWTPLSVLCLIGLVALWLVGLGWTVFWTIGYLATRE